MKAFGVVIPMTLVLAGCSTLGLTSRYRSDGPISRTVLDGLIAFDFQNPKVASETLGRGKKMFQAGATVDARLLTPAGRKLDFLAEAQRTRESREAIEKKFADFEKLPQNELCFVASLTHQTIDLAKASGWKFKPSVDDGDWITLHQVGRDSIPSYSVGSGVTEWFSSGIYCGEAQGWISAKNNIRLKVFPPIYVNPGEALLTWNIETDVASQ